jgi:2-polyprenyl-3-methyl-5-hydroxy-6-metoxy-1,4-benzoquinol methylase
MAPLISQYARTRKLEYFFGHLDKEARILEVGCADGWVGAYALGSGWTNFVGLDLATPATPPQHDFVCGDINQWRDLGLAPESFDAIIAFEVIEHGDFYDAMYALLRPGGKLMVTTPKPSMDWACRILEGIGLNQRRTSPHDHLINLRDLPEGFRPVDLQVKAFISQWGVFEKVPKPARQQAAAGA